MDHLGTDFNTTGSVMSRSELEEVRRKRGECVTCGRKCFKKKLFRMDPIDDHGRVLNGRCLNCHPLDAKDGLDASVMPAVSRPATEEDLARFTRSQSNLSSRALQARRKQKQKKGRQSMTNLVRGDRSVGSATSSTPRPEIGRRSASMMITGSSGTSTVIGESQAPSRGGALANESWGESQALSAPVQPSKVVMSNGSHHSQDASMLARDRQLPPNRRSIAATVSDLGPRANADPGPSQGHPVAPTADELQRAAMTLLAAKQHGVYEDAFQPNDMRDINHQLDRVSAHQRQLENYDRDQDYETELGGGRASSVRSMRSTSTFGDNPDEIDGYDIPQHGILNRGGAFPLSPRPTNNRAVSHVVSGSNRTLSSMSSFEDDSHRPASGRSLRSGGVPVEALHEESGESCTSLPSPPSSRHSRGHSGHSETQDLDAEYLGQLRDSGRGSEEILAVLKEGLESPVVAKQSLEDLARLQFNPDDHNVLSEMGAPQLISHAMQAHASSLEVQLWGCGAIWNMSGTIRSQLAFVDAGALDVILAAMDSFIDDIDLQEKAIATLSNLGAAQDNLPLLVDKGAIRRIVEAMNKHSEVASVQMKGCAAVTNLASHDSPMKQQIMEFGAGGAVVVAMVMHPDDFLLQEKALRGLRNICANSESNKVELANIGGIDAVITAMQVHRDESGVQEEGAWTLSNLAGNDDNKAVIGDCGGIDVVIRAMWVHADNVGVQEWCSRALYTLTLDPQNGEVVLQVGGISAVVNTMQAHVDSPTVQEMGCAVLGNLAGTDQNRMRIVDEEALDAIVLAMVLHSDDMQVQERACMVLLRLAIEQNVKSMQAANIPELVRVAADKFPERCEEPALRLINALEGA